jgi:hypothetical protein
MSKFKVGDIVYVARYAPSNMVRPSALASGELQGYITNRTPFVVTFLKFYEAELELLKKYTNTSLKSGGNI